MNHFLPSNIKFLRKQKRLSQEALADILGKKSSAVGGWETEYSYPDYAMIHKIAEYFGISVGDLIEKDLENSKGDTKINSNNNTISKAKDLNNIHQVQGGMNNGSDSSKDMMIEFLNRENKMLKEHLDQANETIRTLNNLLQKK